MASRASDFMTSKGRVTSVKIVNRRFSPVSKYASQVDNIPEVDGEDDLIERQIDDIFESLSTGDVGTEDFIDMQST